MQNTIPQIQLENIESLFLADEVKTHSLSGVKPEIHRGDDVSKEGRA